MLPAHPTWSCATSTPTDCKSTISPTIRSPARPSWATSGWIGNSRVLPKCTTQHLVDNELELLTCAPMGADARAAPSCGFRTIQVCPKSAARKHAQALALSIARIPRLWQQRLFAKVSKPLNRRQRSFVFLGGAVYESRAAEIRFPRFLRAVGNSLF
jgi:hypothetical protein